MITKLKEENKDEAEWEKKTTTESKTKKKKKYEKKIVVLKSELIHFVAFVCFVIYFF